MGSWVPNPERSSGSRDSITIPIGPLRALGQRAGASAKVSLSTAVSAFVIIAGALLFALFSAAIWALSDAAYNLHWIIGFPIRLVAIAVGITAAFVLLGAAWQLLVLLVMSLWLLARAALGKPID